MPESRRIPVRKEDVWTFTERNVSLWDILDFFPPDAVGPRGPGDAPRPYEVKAVTIETDWLKAQLSPQFAVVRETTGELAFSRYDNGDAHSLTIETPPVVDSLRVRVTLCVYPD